MTIARPGCIEAVKKEIAESLAFPGSDMTVLEKIDTYIKANLFSHATKTLAEFKIKVAKATFQEVKPYELPLILDNDIKNYKIKRKGRRSFFGFDYKRFFKTTYKLRHLSNLRVNIPVGIALKMNELKEINLRGDKSKCNYHLEYSLFDEFYAFAPAECFYKDAPKDPLLIGMIDPVGTSERYYNKEARKVEHKFYLIGSWG